MLHKSEHISLFIFKGVNGVGQVSDVLKGILIQSLQSPKILLLKTVLEEV